MCHDFAFCCCGGLHRVVVVKSSSSRRRLKRSLFLKCFLSLSSVLIFLSDETEETNFLSVFLQHTRSFVFLGSLSPPSSYVLKIKTTRHC